MSISREIVKRVIVVAGVVMVAAVGLSGCVGGVKEVNSEEGATKAIYRVREELSSIEREAREYIDESRLPTDKVIEGYISRYNQAVEQLEEAEKYSKVSEKLGTRYAAAEKQVVEVGRVLEELKEYQESRK